ncbi:MAG: Txe/YoeB family addiction module toxin [Chromatiaceae bacterium]|nr:Txe/YoeB family addiction module toxin [Chromatiaceae bacterium]
MRRVAFERGAFADFNDWALRDKRTHKRILALISDVLRQPFEGIGKPEPLRHELQGCWSRRIDEEHRLVYRVEGDTLVILACRYHYA